LVSINKKVIDISACPGTRLECGRPGGDRRTREELHMGILDELLGGGQRQKDYTDFLSRYDKEIHQRATPIKRFWSGMGKCHTPCRPTSTLKRRKRR
jgi:hypothetical protein